MVTCGRSDVPQLTDQWTWAGTQGGEGAIVGMSLLRPRSAYAVSMASMPRPPSNRSDQTIQLAKCRTPDSTGNVVPQNTVDSA
jgi:hypothetical protein